MKNTIAAPYNMEKNHCPAHPRLGGRHRMKSKGERVPVKGENGVYMETVECVFCKGIHTNKVDYGLLAGIFCGPKKNLAARK